MVDVFKEQFSKTDDAVNFLGYTIAAAQDILMAEQKKLNVAKKMKTTAVGIVTDDRFERAFIS